jgi:antitoxin HicB
MKETDMARKKDAARKRKVIRSTAKLTTLDDFLGEEGKRDEFEAIAFKEVLAWQIERAMKEKNISRNNLAQRMKTSRSQIGRLLDPKDGNVTLTSFSAPRAWSGGRSGWNWCERKACLTVEHATCVAASGRTG